MAAVLVGLQSMPAAPPAYMVVLLAPLGQLLASGLLPTAKSPASSLRRLDSLLITAPVWCVGVGLLS